MANFTIQMAKPDIIAASVELERKKFADYLAVQYGKQNKVLSLTIFFLNNYFADGLANTRNWLLKYVNTDQTVPDNVEYEKFIKTVVKRAFCQACVDLIDWPQNVEYPEVSGTRKVCNL